MPIEKILKKFINREKDIRTETWYIAATCTISFSNRPDDIESLYNVIYEHIYQLPNKSKEEQDQILADVLARLIETANKSYPLIGFPKSMNITLKFSDIIPHNIKARLPKDRTGHDESYDTIEKYRKTGHDLFIKIYGSHENASVPAIFSVNPKMDTIILNCMYGPIFSDYSILSPEETSIVLVSCTMAQNTRLQYEGHCRGAIKNGLNEHEVENTKSVVAEIANYYNLPVPT